MKVNDDGLPLMMVTSSNDTTIIAVANDHNNGVGDLLNDNGDKNYRDDSDVSDD